MCRAQLRRADAQQLDDPNRQVKWVRDDRRVDEGQRNAQLTIDLADEQRRGRNRCAVELGEAAQSRVVVLTREADPDVGFCGRDGLGPCVRRATQAARGAADHRRERRALLSCVDDATPVGGLAEKLIRSRLCEISVQLGIHVELGVVEVVRCARCVVHR